MSHQGELVDISKQLSAEAAKGDTKSVAGPLKALQSNAEQVGRSFSGSWLGYHAAVYYNAFQPIPNGAHFSSQNGLRDVYGDSDTRGNWAEYNPEEVIQVIYRAAEVHDLSIAEEAASAAKRAFAEARAAALSILELETSHSADAFLSNVKDDLGKARPLSATEIIRALSQRGQIVSSDMRALVAGIQVPPHIRVLAEVESIRTAFSICASAADLCSRAASHIDRRERKSKGQRRLGSLVFIGHGRSSAWRELKDFVRDRLQLPWDEFNRVPIAGVANITRLTQMLDDAAFALLVLTAEDEMSDGDMQPRMNVVHEAGLFQGRLGFTKAIILLEEGCKDFSNIEGLGQIRFPKDRISASFEDVRAVLEREGLLD